MKPLKFVGSALEDLQGFAVAARRAAGFELWAIQRGLLPSDWKAMPTVGRVFTKSAYMHLVSGV